ncbi:MAG: hypothetical protein GY929_13740 [Actinomycetia bacterium]|nr:hypothetical protein [Actinomycetes bacterium]
MQLVSTPPHWARLLFGAALVALTLSISGLTDTATAQGGNSDGHHAADDPDAPSRSIIIEPNSGSEPENFGDRGGTGQTLLFFLIVGAVAGGGLHIVRHARQSRAALEAADESTPA